MILADQARSDWSSGRYKIERKCDHKRGNPNRSYECTSPGWHVNTTSDDLADAHQAVIDLARYGVHRIVDSQTGEVL